MKAFTSLFATCLLAIVASSWAAPQARIAGGDDAVLGQVPYIAALSIAGLYTCSAVILNENYALTSLYCVCSTGSDKPWPPQMYQIAAGTVDLYTGGSRIRLEEIIVNPNYVDLATGVALLKLTVPLKFSETIQPIALSKEIPPVYADVEVAGWGRTFEGEAEMHRTLQINDASVIETIQCSRTLGRSLTQDALCLSHPRKNGICRGDFGGPAVYEGKLVGIAASVEGECGSMLPDVFTSVAWNYDWIMEQINL